MNSFFMKSFIKVYELVSFTHSTLIFQIVTLFSNVVIMFIFIDGNPEEIISNVNIQRLLLDWIIEKLFCLNDHRENHGNKCQKDLGTL